MECRTKTCPLGQLGSLTIVDAKASLEGEAVLPGFSCSMREILG